MSRLINIKGVLKVISGNLLILGASILFCVGVAAYYSEPIMPFVISAAISFVLALFLKFISRNKREELIVKKREAYLTVSLSWILISLVGCLPYLLSSAIPSFVDAIFESVSGFTTTGSSILFDVESLPKSILFWRSLTHWIGGIGIIVLVIIVMPALRTSGYHLFSLESSLQDKIRPRIKSVGKRLLLIYISLTILETLFLLMGGMNLFDSICHAFGTVATGGFSTNNNSLAGYSPYIQYTVMIFMLLAGTNFVFYYYLFARDFKKVKKNEEIKFYLKIILFLGLTLTLSLFFSTNKTFEVSFREGFFQLISIVSCTGFSTTDYLLWPSFGWLILFLAMFIGGCTGSTAGGIKMARHLILLKNIKKAMRQLISPNAVIPIKINNEVIGDEMNTSIITFISVYILVFILGSIVLILLNLDIKTASSAVATCLAGIGPGIGKVGPMNNFSHLSPIVKIILSFIMLVGRLEIYSILLLFTPTFWKN